MNNLPAKSNNYPMKRERPETHIRILESGRKTIVNKNFHKKKRAIIPAHFRTPPTTNPQNSLRAEGSKSGFESSIKLPVKLRWQDVLKPQHGPTELYKAAMLKKKYADILKSLGPNEVFAQNIHLHYPSSYQSVMGEVEFLDDNGFMQSIPMEFRSSGASMIEWLQEQQELGNPVILIRDTESGLFDFLGGVREARMLGPADYIPFQGGGYSMSPAPTKGNPDRVKVTGSPFDDRPSSKELFFDSMDAVNDAVQKANAVGKDLFGRRLSPQSELEEFK